MKLFKLDGTCAPCALKYLSKKSNEEVLEACLAQGMNDEDWIAAAKLLGLNFREIPIEKQEVRKFLKNHKDGTFIVGTINHLFVVENGEQVDPRNSNPPGLRRIIQQAWRVL